jgi:hypothetical protein
MTGFDIYSDPEHDDMDDELTQEEIEANFLRGLQEVLSGQTYPVDQLWDKVDDDSA